MSAVCGSDMQSMQRLSQAAFSSLDHFAIIIIADFFSPDVRFIVQQLIVLDSGWTCLPPIILPPWAGAMATRVKAASAAKISFLISVASDSLSPALVRPPLLHKN